MPVAARSWLVTFCHSHTRRREREQEVEQGYQSSNLTSDDILPSARVHLLKTPRPLQGVQPTGDLEFKYLSLWGHFFNSTYLWEGLGSSTKCEENLGMHCPVSHLHYGDHIYLIPSRATCVLGASKWKHALQCDQGSQAQLPLIRTLDHTLEPQPSWVL